MKWPHNKMVSDAKSHENEIQVIVDLFRNLDTPREQLLSYIYDSYPILETIEKGELFSSKEKGGRQ